MMLPFGRHRAREVRAAERFADALDHPPGCDPAEVVAAALRPHRPLNEARRLRAREAMLAAFDTAESSDARPITDVGAPEVSTAEVLTDSGLVRMADIDHISDERAQEVADKVLRQLHQSRGDARGFRSDFHL